MRELAVLVLACLCLPAWAQSIPYEERLPLPVARALKAAGIPQQAVGVVVQEAGAVFPRVSHNAGQAMNPASATKLLTTFAALELLGPAFNWQTEALAAVPPAEGVLAGDLILRGSGDPKLTFEQFWLLLRALRARGVRDIRGDLVLDRSAFAAADHDENAFDSRPLRPYNVGPDALLLNFKAVRLTLLRDGDRVLALPEPAPANLELVNLIKPSNGTAACGDWREELRADLSRRDDHFRLVLTGNYPAACGEQRWNIGVMPHAEYVLGVFRQLWTELGGSFAGTVRAAVAPPDARVLATVASPPLAEIVRDINKFSNNVMARQLYLALGRTTAAGNAPLDAGAAEAAVRRWLGERGLSFPELVLDNGSGLSRRGRISADSMARLLQAAWKSAVMPELMSSLPLTAVDGTMRKRLRDGAAAGQAHVKTGSLEGVKTIAGYVLDRSGRRQIVVFFVNHANAAAAQPAQDALLQWVYERGA